MVRRCKLAKFERDLVVGARLMAHHIPEIIGKEIENSSIYNVTRTQGIPATVVSAEGSHYSFMIVIKGIWLVAVCCNK